MNNTIRSFFIAVVASMAALSFSSCVKEEISEVLRKETDAVNIAYNEGATKTVTVRYNGAWYATSEVDWLKVSPDLSSPMIGNGKDFQKVTITASRNTGDKREGTIHLVSSNGTQDAKVIVTQEEGKFTIEKPALTGTLTKGESAAAAVVVKYSKAAGGEKVVVAASISGDDALSIAPETEFTIANEGDGSLSVPVKGVVSRVGEVTLNASVKVAGVEMASETITSAILSPDIVYIQTFDKMIFGGDYPNNAPGIGVEGKQTYYWNAPEDMWQPFAKNDQDGTYDVFGDSNESWKAYDIKAYREDRGLSGWSGARCYEHPGYLKVGTGSNYGWFQLPALSNLKGETTVTLTMKLLRFDNTDGTIEITAEGGGTVIGGVLTSENFPAQTKAADRKWTVRSFRIDGATPDTRIKVSTENSANIKTTRFNVDSIVVSTSVVKLTEPLKAIDASEIKTYPSESSILVEWPTVENADAYALTIYSTANPNFKYSVETDQTSYTFDSIQSGEYMFEITAISHIQPEFNSETTVKKIGTAGYVFEKLEAPANVKVEANGVNVNASWSVVPGCSLFKAEIFEENGTEALATKYVNTTSVQFTKLTPTHRYYVTLQSVVSEASANEYDSEIITTSVVEIAKPELKAEIVFVNESQYGIRWTLSDYENFDFDYASTYTLATYKDEACTDLHSSFKFASKQSIFSSTRNIPFKVSPQFMVSGLDSGRDYWVKVTDTSFEVSKTVKVTTEASKVVTMPSGTASAGDIILFEDFSEWPFGGECVRGFSGWALKTTSSYYENYNALGEDPIGDGSKLIYCTADKHSGLMNTFKWHVPNTRQKDWGAILESNKEGALCMAAGLVKIGASSKYAQIVTPAINCLSGTAEVEVSFDAAPYMDPTDGTSIPYKFDPATAIVQVYNNSARQDESKFINHEIGTPSEDQVHKFTLPTASDSDYKWTHHTFTVTVNNGDAIAIGSYRDDPSTKNQRRMYLDNIQLKVVSYK